MIPQTDPRANYLKHRNAIDGAIRRVLESGRYILGQEVRAFEQEFAAYLGVSHVIGVGNGTDALELALRACGVGAGDLVFTVSHTAVATVAAIERTGARPVLVDIDLDTYTMSPEALEAALCQPPPGTPKAIIPVHLYGHPADLSAIVQLALQYGLRVIEDCAQSHGARVEGKLTGSWGDLAAFSFYPTKNLGALGDGGAVATDNVGLAEQLRLLQQYGWRERYISDIPGGNSRLDELQAAILRVKLPYLDEENARRRALARHYEQLLADTGLILPVCKVGTEHVYHQYVVRSPRRDALQARLREQGIGTLIHYPQAVHQQPAYAGRLTGKLPHSEIAVAQVLSLPMYPELGDAQIHEIAHAIQQAVRAMQK